MHPGHERPCQPRGVRRGRGYRSQVDPMDIGSDSALILLAVITTAIFFVAVALDSLLGDEIPWS